MDYTIQWTCDGTLFDLLLVGESEQLKFFIEWFKKMGLKEENTEKQNILEGNLILLDDNNKAYPMKITIITPTEFIAIKPEQLKFDGIIIYKKGADLSSLSTIEPYKRWEDWGEGKVKKLMFLDAMIGIAPYELMNRIQGDYGMSSRFSSFLRALQKKKIIDYELRKILAERI